MTRKTLITTTLLALAGSQASAQSPTIIRDNDRPTRQVFMQRVPVTMSGTATTVSVDIPAGKVLVLEQVGFSGNLNTATASFRVQITNGAQTDSITLIPKFYRQNANGFLFIHSEQVRFYSSGATRVGVFSDAGAASNVFVQLIGHLVDEP
ncbi:MAG: hypothetical protein FJW39_22535 [Acidobacteria bacterium]|nr:hypothetical protein [Acidobacteriota bacterium]